MRIRLLSGFLAAGLLASNVATAAQICARPADREAFGVTGLKSKLMITALTCNAHDKYNAFIARFRPTLTSEDRALHSYFNRAYGRRGQAQHDDYITQLANAQSQRGLQDGTAFCQRNLSLFDEVLALQSASQLAQFAEARQLVQPIALTDCASRTPAVRKVSEHHVMHKPPVHHVVHKEVRKTTKH